MEGGRAGERGGGAGGPSGAELESGWGWRRGGCRQGVAVAQLGGEYISASLAVRLSGGAGTVRLAPPAAAAAQQLHRAAPGRHSHLPPPAGNAPGWGRPPVDVHVSAPAAAGRSPAANGVEPLAARAHAPGAVSHVACGVCWERGVGVRHAGWALSRWEPREQCSAGGAGAARTGCRRAGRALRKTCRVEEEPLGGAFCSLLPQLSSRNSRCWSRASPGPAAAQSRKQSRPSICRGRKGASDAAGPAMSMVSGRAPGAHDAALEAFVGSQLQAIHKEVAGGRSKEAQALRLQCKQLIGARRQEDPRRRVAGGGGRSSGSVRQLRGCKADGALGLPRPSCADLLEGEDCGKPGSRVAVPFAREVSTPVRAPGQLGSLLLGFSLGVMQPLEHRSAAVLASGGTLLAARLRPPFPAAAGAAPASTTRPSQPFPLPPPAPSPRLCFRSCWRSCAARWPRGRPRSRPLPSAASTNSSPMPTSRARAGPAGGSTTPPTRWSPR